MKCDADCLLNSQHFLASYIIITGIANMVIPIIIGILNIIPNIASFVISSDNLSHPENNFFYYFSFRKFIYKVYKIYNNECRVSQKNRR